MIVVVYITIVKVASTRNCATVRLEMWGLVERIALGRRIRTAVFEQATITARVLSPVEKLAT